MPAAGRRRAEVVAEELCGKRIAAVFCSPLDRCQQTAAAIADTLPAVAAPTISAAFAPLSGGDMQSGPGYGWDWRVSKWKQGVDSRPPGGESLADGVRRARRAIDEAVQSHRSSAIVVVSHGDIIPGLLGEAAGTPMVDRCFRHDVPGGSISRIDINRENWSLKYAGKTE